MQYISIEMLLLMLRLCYDWRRCAFDEFCQNIINITVLLLMFYTFRIRLCRKSFGYNAYQFMEWFHVIDLMRYLIISWTYQMLNYQNYQKKKDRIDKKRMSSWIQGNYNHAFFDYDYYDSYLCWFWQNQTCSNENFES